MNKKVELPTKVKEKMEKLISLLEQ